MRNNAHVRIHENIETKAKVYLIIIASIMVILCINNAVYIIPSLMLYTLLICYTVWESNKRRGEISTYIEELTISVDSVAKNTLINSPFPIIVLETDGNIIWRSSNFNKEFANVGINTYIDDIAKEITTELEEDTKQKFNKKMEIGDKTYHIIGNGIKTRQRDKKKQPKYMTILYFIDITEEQSLLKKYNDSQTCVGIIMIDNFEEIIRKNCIRRKTTSYC